MREVLDPVNPEDLRSAFTNIHRQLQRQRILEEYQYLGGYLASVDGTGQFSSNKVSCEECCSRNLRNGEKQYYHQLVGAVIVHPDKSNVLPLFPEAITREDGQTKNDCSCPASKRLLAAIRQDFPKLNIIIVEEALASNAPHIRLIKELSFSYILVSKPSDHAYLFEKVEESKKKGNSSHLEILLEDGTKQVYHYVNNIPLNASNPDLLVNLLEYWEFKEAENNFIITLG